MKDDIVKILQIYESKIDQLQIIKATVKKGSHFYKDCRLPKAVLTELMDDFYSMEMARLKDDPWEYFFYLYKQIENMLSHCVNHVISHERILEELEKEKFLMDVKWDDSKANKIKTQISAINRDIYFGYKLDIFYSYYVRLGGNSRNEELNFYVTNQIKDGRNYYSHGGGDMSNEINRINDKHDSDIYSFYTTYEVLHRKFVNYIRYTHEQIYNHFMNKKTRDSRPKTFGKLVQEVDQLNSQDFERIFEGVESQND
jgi:hypothetical protein